MTATLSRSLLTLAAAAAALIAPGCGGTASRTVTADPPKAVAEMTPRGCGETLFDQAWELELPGPVVRSWISPKVRDLVFFQIAGSNEIHCVDSASGMTKWVSESFTHPILGDAFVHHLDLPGEREREIIVDRRLYIVVDDTLHCLDVGTGHRIWKQVLDFAPSTGPLAAGDNEANLRVFIGDWNNKVQVYGMNVPIAERGRKFPYNVWQMPLPGVMLASAGESEGQTYVGDNAGNIHAFKLDRVKVWSAATGGSVEGGVTTRGRVLYAGNEGNAVHAINRLTGERLGQFNLDGPVRKRPFWFVGEPERLYVWVDPDSKRSGPVPDAERVDGLVALRVQPDNIAYADGNKHALEVVRMGFEWRVPGATRLLGSTPLHLLVGDSRADLVWAVHRGTGKVEWTWDVSRNFPGKGGKVEHLVSHLDPSDQLRSLIAVDAAGKVVSFRRYGFVPTPAQERTGLTSRSLADAATAKQQAAEKAADKPAAEAPAEAAPAP